MDNIIHHDQYRIRRERILTIGQLFEKFIPNILRSTIADWLKKFLAVIRPSLQIRSRVLPSTQFRPNPDQLTVISANLWHDWPLRRKLPQRLESFARMIEAENADVVLLQEVIRATDFSADEWLADRLGMAYAYTRVNGDETSIGFEEGLAIFSRHPILGSESRHLGLNSGVTRRLALASEVKSPLGDFLAISVHLGFLRNRNKAQMIDLFAWVKQITAGRTALIGGDFNTPENSFQIGQAQRSWLDTYRTLHPDADGTTFELRWPWGNSIFRRRFDYIFLQQGNSNWGVIEARHVDEEEYSHSDHRSVIARLAPRK